MPNAAPHFLSAQDPASGFHQTRRVASDQFKPIPRSLLVVHHPRGALGSSPFRGDGPCAHVAHWVAPVAPHEGRCIVQDRWVRRLGEGGCERVCGPDRRITGAGSVDLGPTFVRVFSVPINSIYFMSQMPPQPPPIFPFICLSVGWFVSFFFPLPDLPHHRASRSG